MCFSGVTQYVILLQALHNVFRTGDTNADEVLNNLKTTVDRKFIPYKQSEYVS